MNVVLHHTDTTNIHKPRINVDMRREQYRKNKHKSKEEKEKRGWTEEGKEGA